MQNIGWSGRKLIIQQSHSDLPKLKLTAASSLVFLCMHVWKAGVNLAQHTRQAMLTGLQTRVTWFKATCHEPFGNQLHFQSSSSNSQDHKESSLKLPPAAWSCWGLWLGSLCCFLMASNTQWSDTETHGHKVSYANSLFNETLWLKRSSLIFMFYFFSTSFQKFLSWQKINTH